MKRDSLLLKYLNNSCQIACFMAKSKTLNKTNIKKSFALKIQLILLAMLLMSGCSEKDSLLIPEGKDRLNKYVAARDNEIFQKKEEPYITMQDQSIYSVLMFLEKKDRVSYFLDGKDIPLPNSSFKVRTFEDFLDYVENTTDYTIKEESVNGKFIKIKPVLKKEILSIFDKPLPISVQDRVILYAVFNAIRDITGYDVIVDKSLDEFFSENYYLDIKADSISNFFESFSKKHDIYIDVDNQKKRIEISRTKKAFFSFHIPLEYMPSMMEPKTSTISSGTGTVAGAGAISSPLATTSPISTTSIFSALDKSLQALKRSSILQSGALSQNRAIQALLRAGPDFDYSINETTGVVYVEATPSMMEEAKQIIKKFKEEVLVNINIKFTIYRVLLNKENNYGIDWSLSSLSKDFKQGSSFLLTDIDNARKTAQDLGTQSLNALDISRPTIFKIGQDNGLSGGTIDVKFLNKFGTVSEIKSFNIITLNNFKIKQEITKDYQYVSSIRKTRSTTTQESLTDTTFETSNAKSGIILTVTPRYNAITDTITLSISPIITSVSLRNFSPSTTETVQLATTDLTDVSNNIILKKGEKLIISGIINEVKGDSYSGLAPEGTHELLQGVVGQKAKNKEREETIVTIEVDVAR